jgi:hypothetical protein
MNESEKKAIDIFFKNFPREEVVDVLSDINTKINSLHTVSSKDFLYFNKLLKQHYRNIKEISNANNTISVFLDKDLPEIKNEIKDKNTVQLQLLESTDDNNIRIVELLTQIYSSVKSLSVPANNFKQNLTTLKYILANLKLHLNYVEIINGKELRNSLLIIENSVEKIYDKIENVTEKTENILQYIDNFKNLIINSSTDNTKLRKELRNELEKISSEDYLNKYSVIDLNNRTQKCFTYMGEVITNIQYHDIIRQKMEHVQSSQDDLIKELKDSTKASVNSENLLSLIIKIPEIINIQAAQLLYTNRDYQTSIERITNQLIDVSNETAELTTIYNSIHKNTFKFEDSFIFQVDITQTEFKTFFDRLIINEKMIHTQNDSLKVEYDSLKKEYNSLFQKEKTLRKEVKIFESLIKINGEDFGKELMQILKNLFSNLQVNSNSLKTHLNSTTHGLNSLINITSNIEIDDKNHYIRKESVNNITDKSTQIKQKTKEYAVLSTEISNEIMEALKNIEYYNYFKTTIEDIVESLNKINKIVNYDSLKSSLGNNKEFLKKIEMEYTMKSERDIHKKLMDSNMGIEDLLNEKDNNSTYDIDDNDIELF